MNSTHKITQIELISQATLIPKAIVGTLQMGEVMGPAYAKLLNDPPR